MTDPKYGSAHQKLRATLLPGAWGKRCPRCGHVMLKTQDLDLDHGDLGQKGYLGIVHATCNRRAGGALGKEMLKARIRAEKERRNVQFEQAAIGVEISEDRLHVSIGVAGTVAGEAATVIKLYAYLEGTAFAAANVAALAKELGAPVAIDTHSQAATLLDPLVGLKLKNLIRLSASDVVIAHGVFMDELNAGNLRHIPHPKLDAAARAGVQRNRGGAQEWDRRTSVDTSPLTAVTFALRALRLGKPKPPPLAVL